MIEPIGDAIEARSAGREGAGCSCSIILIDGLCTAQFLVLVTVPLPWEGNEGPLSSQLQQPYFEERGHR